MIRLTIPSIEEDDLLAVREAVASGQLVQGVRVANFEAAIARYLGCRHAIAVSNCTAALHLSLLAVGVQAGDTVAVSAYSWPATANVVELCGARPVFVDIQPDTFNMDPAQLDHVLARHRVKAVLPVHAFGQMADMPAILEVAGRHGVPVIEDAACALGAKLQNHPAGTWGLTGCFSFHPRKAITTGEGGVIATNDDRVTRQCRILRNHGLDPDSSTPDFVAPGFNLRMTEFQAALGLSQLGKLDRIITARRTAADRYTKLLAGTSVTPPVARPTSDHIYQSYVVLLPRDLVPRRAELIATWRAQGIETTIGTYHIPLTTYYRQRYGFKPGMFPVADDVSSRALTLPLYERITIAEQEQVVAALRAI